MLNNSKMKDNTDQFVNNNLTWLQHLSTTTQGTLENDQFNKPLSWFQN